MNSDVDFYNSLELSLKYAEGLLVDAVNNSKSIFHSPTLCISDSPRTVVLREFNKEKRFLRFHTDLRSKKINSINENLVAYVHGYDPEIKVQLRIKGKVKLHKKDEKTLKAWEGSREMSKLCYSVKGAPGQIITDPNEYDLIKSEIDVEKGYENFGVIIFEYDEIEFLFLKNIGHRRSKFSWKDHKVVMEWLIP